jgi:hypothetical protein
MQYRPDNDPALQEAPCQSASCTSRQHDFAIRPIYDQAPAVASAVPFARSWFQRLAHSFAPAA